MCTVSFISAGGRTIITSNRDEHIQRPKASAPGFEIKGNKKIIFPKDSKAGGTWFAAADNGVVTVLLNGAFEKHIPQPPYRKSRGLVLLEIMEAGDPQLFYRNMNLQGIEPFTLVLYRQAALSELRWDGTKKHELLLDTAGSYIWSSATLYSPEVIAHRKELFERFISSTKDITPERVQQFHADDHQDEENGFIINRQTGMRTFSITQAVLGKSRIDFLHYDLLQQRQFSETMYISPSLIHQ